MSLPANVVRAGLIAMLAITAVAPASAQAPVRTAVAVPADVEAIIRADMLGRLVSLDALIRALADGDRAGARAAARQMTVERAGERSGPGYGIGPHLPARFRALGQDMHVAAEALLAALHRTEANDRALLRGVSAITETCVACHDAYVFE